MYDDPQPIKAKWEPLWRRLLLWKVWPLRWRGPAWFWVEEHTRMGR
jgi:hypothetical protein